VIGSAFECDLDILVSRCGDFSWGQVQPAGEKVARIAGGRRGAAEKRCRWLVVDNGKEPLYYVAN
jgi:hypothetical protein